MRPLPQSTVDNVKVQLRHGKSARQVSKDLGVSISFALKVRQQDKENIPDPKIGRPTKVSGRTRAALKSKMLDGEFRRLTDAQNYVRSMNEGPVCKRTVVNYLEAQGLPARRKPESPRLTKKHIAARKKFAREHVNWTLDQWKQVMFSDECSVHRIKPFGTQYYYSNEEHRLRHEDHFKQKAQGGGGRIMIWGCITSHGPGDLGWVEGTMDSEYYERVLRDYLVPSRDYCGMDPETFIFQHDNCSIHTAGRIKRYLENAGITVLEWPPNSPDINPIERVWAYIKQRLDSYPTPAESLQQLFDRVVDIWTSLPENFLAKLYAELPAKMRMLVHTGGLHSQVPKGTGSQALEHELGSTE